MHTTSPSLLQRLRHSGVNEAWTRFVELYTPLLYYWTRKSGLAESDAADVVQDVLAKLLEKLPGFDYKPGRSFRNWLLTITQNQCREWFRRESLRRGKLLGEMVDPASCDPASVLADHDYRDHVLQQAMIVMQRDFEHTTWEACLEHVIKGRDAAAVAVELGISLNSVYIAKARVLKRLRQELDGLLD